MLRKGAAALLLVLIASVAALSLAAAAAPRASGCHCPVRMACCEDGTCTMGGAEAPAAGPEWRTCRREAPATAAAPLDAFERALMDSEDDRAASEGARVADSSTARAQAGAPTPATPPPRSFSF